MPGLIGLVSTETCDLLPRKKVGGGFRHQIPGSKRDLKCPRGPRQAKDVLWRCSSDLLASSGTGFRGVSEGEARVVDDPVVSHLNTNVDSNIHILKFR